MRYVQAPCLVAGRVPRKLNLLPIVKLLGKMAAVTIFLEEYEDAPDYDFLNRIICQWRRAEEETRESCGMASVRTHYPGCFFYKRDHSESDTSARRLRQRQAPLQDSPRSVADLLLGNHIHHHTGRGKPRTVAPDEEQSADTIEDWDAFIASYVESEEQNTPHNRRLIDYEHVGPWFNYFPMLGVRTEYYYRYSGTQTVPPCYGQWFSGNDRRQTNHWRVMKDPIRVSKRQIDEMHRLLRERIAPADDVTKPCEPDTAAKIVSNSSRVSVARPVQSTRGVHFEVFCQCQDWTSKWPEDRQWCEMDKLDRFYHHPYNFETDGF
jgi:hypothetical protein